MLKPVQQSPYRIRYYVAAIAIWAMQFWGQQSSEGCTQPYECAPPPKTLSQDFHESGKLAFIRQVGSVSPTLVSAVNAFDLLQPSTEKLFKIVSFLAELGSSVPIAASGPADTGDNQSPKGTVDEKVGCTEVNLGHLILFGIVQTLISFVVGFGAYLWGRKARLENPYSIGGNTRRAS